ncbi:MAG: ABC transporter ATP-binding protein/permease [Butyrivibrio sp.]|uniref:ABC transporter ATP-binding protein n=1 Tax=Butyrivibrio sp. TaxID=28121 RepID=UPI0025E97E26|nr:ABC transporter ATP-binding protein [Butyrivibrio sp.]MCR5769964.1 ABC transporter ATP-binding protein/permease [Butyrivibrio sp.]
MDNKDTNVKLPWYGIPRLIPYLKKYKYKIIAMVFIGAIVTAIDAIYPLFNRYVLNKVVGENDTTTLPYVAIGYVALLLCQVVMNYYSTFMCSKMELWVNRDLRNASFGHLQTLSFSYFNQNNVGYIHARVMSDTGKIGELVSWRMMDIVWNGVYILGVIVVMFAINTRLALYIIVLVPIAAVIIMLFQKKLVVLNRAVREHNSKITGNFNEGITGVRSIKTLVAEERMKRNFEDETFQMRVTSIRSAHVQALFAASVTFLSAMTLSLVLWQGGSLTQQKLMEIGTLSVFMSYALGIMDPIQSIINTISALIAIQVNIERFTRLMSTESDVADSKEVIEKYGDTFNAKKENWEPLHGDVEFKDVSFMYPDGDEYVLENFNLKVPHGFNVAIVGETGAGKSTLVNLVCRFFEPTKGEVLIDGIDARKRSQLWLHSNIGYVLQTPHLFSGTVRDNLRYGKPDATDEEINKALALVSADKVVAKMDKGLDSDVGEGGSMLSTGERQLLSFARAILADPRILVLDEATSSVDTVTEKVIQSAIKTVIEGRTSFMIAHRLSTVVDADVILAVRDGKIVEQGNHKELMDKKGYYYELFNRQYEEIAVDLATAE